MWKHTSAAASVKTAAAAFFISGESAEGHAYGLILYTITLSGGNHFSKKQSVCYIKR